jgi:hypothetical protein
MAYWMDGVMGLCAGAAGCCYLRGFMFHKPAIQHSDALSLQHSSAPFIKFPEEI